MTQTPYNPVNRLVLAGDAEIAAMHVKLARKLRPKIEITARAEATPKAELRNPLEWGKPYNTGPGTAMIKTLCGLFRIDRLTTQAFVSYTAWKLTPAGEGLHTRLGAHDTGELAKAACEDAR